MKTVKLLYGKDGMTLGVPDGVLVLEGEHVPAIENIDLAVAGALESPIASPPLAELVARKKPRTVAITVSDITRPVPNSDFLPAMLEVLNAAGVDDCDIVIVIGTGMHRPSTPEERRIILGEDVLARIEVIDHRADDSETLVKVCDYPPVSICRRFAEADFRIVTGYIEPHFMAGFSGGRKGVCPALVDLATVQRFHGFDTLASDQADSGILEGNPCHEIASKVATVVGVDFLFNVAITREHRTAGIYCGDLFAAHKAGCEQVARWTTVEIDGPFDFVITNGGGFPLDQTFYQTVKGMCTALPAMGGKTTMLQVSRCNERLGSKVYTDLLLKWGHDWRGFLADIEANRKETKLDQWEFQMQCRVLECIGRDNLWFVSDGIDADVQKRIAVNAILGDGSAQTRAQRAIDQYVADNPDARIAVIPDGPYTMLSIK